MGFQYSLAHLSVLGLSPPEMVKVAARAGYEFVSLRMTPVTPTERTYPLMDDPAMMRETKALLADTGLKVLDIELARLGTDKTPEDFTAFLEAGAELGAKHVICQLPNPNRHRAVEHFAKLCDMAKSVELTIDLEFPTWTETPDLKEALRILDTANRNNAGILIDTLHADRSDTSLEELKSIPEQRINFIQLCDAPKERPTSESGLIHAARCERFFPGQSELNLREMLACLPTVPYALEIPNERLIQQLGAEEYARRMLETTKDYLEREHDATQAASLSA